MSTTIRGTEAVKAMRDLFDAYLAECDRIERFKAAFEESPTAVYVDDYADFAVTMQERMTIFEGRRDAIAAKLENKGFKVTAESNDTLPSIARAREGME